MKTLILGIGNTICSDDAVGIHVARALKEKIRCAGLEIKETSEAPINLLDVMVDYEKVIIIDSIHAKDGTPGQVYRFTQRDLNKTSIPSLSHNVALPRIFSLGKRMGLRMPEHTVYYGIQIEEVSFGEELSPKIKEAIPKAVKLVEKEV
jgi:hydrogenase maturation protease